MNIEEGNFNTPIVRMSCLVVVLALQILMMWNFVIFQLKKIRENKSISKSKAVASSRKSKY